MVTLALYVDDLTIEFAHRVEQVVVVILARATDHVVDHLQQRLGLEVSSKKSVVVACRPLSGCASCR